ncbi:MAG: chemotaxis protein CheW [Bacteroidales bacterium]|nr:chemotaxis protein CheW [Bacteroidales bacterium]
MENENLTINSYLVFKIGDEEFAANAGKVQRILEMQEITTVPQAPVYMKGVINLMGRVLPVIDSRLKLGMPPKETDTNTCIIVLEINKDNELVETGLIVDNVQSVIEIQKDEVKDPPSIGMNINVDYIQGMVEQDNKFIMLLNVDKVLSTGEIINLQASINATEKKAPEEEKA